MRLTRAEESIMKILWEVENATVQEILSRFVEAKPARTTVATVLTVLEGKGYVTHSTNGRINIYRPVIEKKKYYKSQLISIIKNCFNDSYSSLFSFFVTESDLTIDEMNEILKKVDESTKK